MLMATGAAADAVVATGAACAGDVAARMDEPATVMMAMRAIVTFLPSAMSSGRNSARCATGLLAVGSTTRMQMHC